MALVVLAVVLAAIGGNAEAQTAQGFDWDKWAAVVNENPCEWLDEDTIRGILGEGATASRTLSRAEHSCVWRAPDGTGLLWVGVTQWDSPGTLASERRGLIRDVDVERMPFISRFDATGGVVTAIFRSDRNLLHLMPNDDGEAASIVIRPAHGPESRGGSAALSARERVLAYGSALIARYGL